MESLFPRPVRHQTMAAPAGRFSFDSYDLPYVVGLTRGVQIVCCVVQLLMIYSESASLSMFWFLLYSVICAYNLFHLSKRWYYNIDGRYDLKQFVSQSEPTVRVQYGAAILTPTLLGLIVFFTIELQNGFVHSILKIATIVQLLMALGQLALEIYEVYVKGN